MPLEEPDYYPAFFIFVLGTIGAWMYLLILKCSLNKIADEKVFN